MARIYPKYTPHRQLTIDFDNPDAATPEHKPAPAANDIPSIEPDKRIMYLSFGSGSSGNCAYIGTPRGGILIDAGVKAETVQELMRSNGLNMGRTHGILLTHDHSDHVRYAYQLLRNNRHLRLFCTNRVLNGLLRRHNISKRIKEYHYPIFKEIPFRVSEMEITAFEVPHDGTDNMGFSIQTHDRRFVVATDLGEVGGRARHYIEQANYLMIEANYDARMLRDGPYPEYLKARIATARGHMDNLDTAALLREIAGPQLQYVFLCHLSEDNNTPQKAEQAVLEALLSRGLKVGDCSMSLADREADIHLMPLPRFDATRLFVFR